MLTRKSAETEAREVILPFWQGLADPRGGFYGEADYAGKIRENADKGCILNSRILWTFSAAYRLLNDSSYKESADRARNFLSDAFLDKEYGGLYWLADENGRPKDTKKHFYNIAFGIYALSEHFRATGDASSLKLAEELFELVEKHGFDPERGGYVEANTREWALANDFALSGKDLNSPKSMNTNLHVLEAYTGLLNAGGGARVRSALKGLIRVTIDKIINKKHNFELFFDMDWKSLIDDISYGHDIEGSWLLYEAALAVGEPELTAEVKKTALGIAEATYAVALDAQNGGFLSGIVGGKPVGQKEWWPQAESVVGFYNAFQLSGDERFKRAAEDCWDYAQNNFSDKKNGDWHNELSHANVPDPKMPKAGFWKCPYHNARACFEIIRRVQGS